MNTTTDETPAPSERTVIKRYGWLAKYDRDTIYSILDAGLVCQIAYVIDGQPFVTPTNFWRIGNHVHWHGSAASRMLRGQGKGIPVCFSVTHLDGVVIARAAFNHNVNFRSIMAFGTAEVLAEEAKRAALKVFSDRLMPGLWEHARQPSEKEWKVTTVLRMALDEVSAKIRTGPPIDDEEDYELDAWSGIIPIHAVTGAVEPDPRLRPGIQTPAFVTNYRY
ncbi:MAG: pyridoxamine 5'-phosphate oxidase family protein [Steroidobacteraceae bacterium]|jgi:nitroimidazol reductase NimA-like FMN-containing flavoprotein (pyridoxamine 5'-phosphate oxidase superfamily)